jgi:anti-sigma factor (TIGR02949 family)
VSDCGCEKARADLEAFVRGELDYCQTAQAEIRDHIETCPGCQNEATVARTMTIAIPRACLDEAAPDELRRRIVSSLKDVQAEPH